MISERSVQSIRENGRRSCMVIMRPTSRAAVLDSPLRRPPIRVLEQLALLTCDRSYVCDYVQRGIKDYFGRYAKTPKKTTEAIA